MTSDTPIEMPAKRSVACRAFYVALISAGIGAAVVASIVAAGLNGFERAVDVFTYLTVPSNDLIRSMVWALLPSEMQEAVSGVEMIIFSAWVQASLIVAAAIGVGYWLATGAFYTGDER